ncbi:MAG: hypothetical protein AAFO75_04080 [Pseudomonadota bacterium]
MTTAQLPDFARPIRAGTTQPSRLQAITPAAMPDVARDLAPDFAIVTLVTDKAQYAEMSDSFVAGGFTPDTCEYLVIDNTDATNQSCAYRGLNRALAAARAPYVILCHQDVRLVDDNRDTLEQRLHDLEQNHPEWALAGNAGGASAGTLAVRISDPHGQDQCVGTFPHRVFTLDENFIIVRRDAQIGFSRNLSGFHFYGADICMAADAMGWEAYVIDFHLHHLSPGKKDASFEIAKEAFRAKWSKALRPRLLQTTCALIDLTSTTLGRWVAPWREAAIEKVTRRLPSATGWTKPSPTKPNPVIAIRKAA